MSTEPKRIPVDRYLSRVRSAIVKARQATADLGAAYELRVSKRRRDMHDELTDQLHEAHNLFDELKVDIRPPPPAPKTPEQIKAVQEAQRKKMSPSTSNLSLRHPPALLKLRDQHEL